MSDRFNSMFTNAVLTKEVIASLGYITMTDYYRKVRETREPPLAKSQER